MVRTELWDAYALPGEVVRKVAHIDDVDGTITIEHKSDVTGLVDMAKVMADEPPGKDFRHAAFIPQDVMDRAFKEGWFNDPKAWKRWANDPNNRAFRTWQGNL